MVLFTNINPKTDREKTVHHRVLLVWIFSCKVELRAGAVLRGKGVGVTPPPLLGFLVGILIPWSANMTF